LHVANLEGKRNARTIVVHSSGEKEAFGRPKATWDANIKLEPKEIK
jgi:hypothetical protein